jgi:hypothetical protein
MKYVAYLKQDGEGCDYTIGCGLEMVKLKSDIGQRKDLTKYVRI